MVQQVEAHPFFTIGSEYRGLVGAGLRGRLGRYSVRGHFESLRCRQLHEEWIYGVPAAAQNWVGGEGERYRLANRAIHDMLRGAYEDARREQLVELAPESPVPEFMGFDLREREVKELAASEPGSVSEPKWVPRFSWERAHIAEKGSSSFGAKVFANVANHWCLALLLDASMFGRLAEHVGQEPRRQNARAIVKEALSPGKMTRGLQRSWSQLGGLEAVTNKGGWFNPSVRLHLPEDIYLSDWVGVVFLLGLKSGRPVEAPDEA